MSDERPQQTSESVWDYPRPPRLEASPRRLTIVHGGIILADTTRSLRILETSHPPVYYIPQPDIAMRHLRVSQRRGSFCEFKGVAAYWSVVSSEGTLLVENAAWSYDQPSPAYKPLADHLAFYASRIDECTVDGERVAPQPGDFYGGWITSHVQGPFKGSPGTLGW